MCQLHISLTRTAQIYLELHFCVELHTKKALPRSYGAEFVFFCLFVRHATMLGTESLDGAYTH